ncbi:MAG: sulfatase [Verrucomicrobiales bacterium]|nr:sulfatase [Verrucomicrobiales bacterium]
MKRLLFFLACLLPILSPAAEKPNLVLIFVDDLGYGDLACYGNKKVKTPNLDRLAAEGQRWTSFYAAGSTCVPSRRGLMSGRHPTLLKDQPIGIREQDILLPSMLKRQGYTNAILGKWHLAGYPEDFGNATMHPLNCGFDSHFGTPGSNDVPPPPGKKQTRAVFDTADKFSFPVPLIRGREVVEFPVNQELLTKRYTEEAVKWIGEQKDGPFFLYLAHNMPHAPIFASPEFQGKSEDGRFGDVVEEIDWSVGQVRKAIDEAGIAGNTLLVFTSDNGPWTAFGPHGGVATPLRGEKSTSWEGGFRVPAIFHWPGKIAPATVDGMGANLDLYATFATLAGSDDLPSEKPGWMSTDLTPALLEGKPSPRTNWLYNRSVYRSGKHKIHYVTKHPTNAETRKKSPMTKHDPPLLYDLDADISETTNLTGDHPGIVEQLTAELEALTR